MWSVSAKQRRMLPARNVFTISSAWAFFHRVHHQARSALLTCLGFGASVVRRIYSLATIGQAPFHKLALALVLGLGLRERLLFLRPIEALPEPRRQHLHVGSFEYVIVSAGSHFHLHATRRQFSPSQFRIVGPEQR